MNFITNTTNTFFDFLADNPAWMFFVGFGLPLIVAVLVAIFIERAQAIFTTRTIGRHRRLRTETSEEFFAMIDRYRKDFDDLPVESIAA